MGQPIGKKKRPKKPAPARGPYWLNTCPVCANVGKVVGIVPCRIPRDGRRYGWACEGCVVTHNLLTADSQKQPRRLKLESS